MATNATTAAMTAPVWLRMQPRSACCRRCSLAVGRALVLRHRELHSWLGWLALALVRCLDGCWCSYPCVPQLQVIHQPTGKFCELGSQGVLSTMGGCLGCFGRSDLSPVPSGRGNSASRWPLQLKLGDRRHAHELLGRRVSAKTAG